MQVNSYIKELKNHLSVLEKSKKEEIVKEIQSYIEESNATYELLVERFGTPKDLAGGYLEDMNISNNNTVYKKTKTIFITIFIFLAITFAIIALIIYLMTRDPFDYTKYDSKTLPSKLEQPWIDLNKVSNIDIYQSKSVIYWSEDKIARIICIKDDEKKLKSRWEIKKGTLFVKQAKCYISLPKIKANIKTYQSKVILIKPQNQIDLKSEQSSIEIAQKDMKYNFNFDKKQSHVDGGIITQKDGVSFKGSLYQSNISLYSY